MNQIFERFRNNILISNTLTNVLAKLWSSILSLISVPIFVNFLGAEAYGLIAIYASFEVIFNFLDLGLSATVNREIARNCALKKEVEENSNLLRTLEVYYWIVGIFVAILIFINAKWVTTNWLIVSELSNDQVIQTIYAMAFLFAAKWPISLYSGVLRGLQKQSLLNGLTVLMVTIRIAGSIIILEFISNTITSFVIWQAVANFTEVLLIAMIAWKNLNKENKSAKAKFDILIVKRIWKFAISFNTVGVLVMILSQADKIIASRFVGLTEIGYYSVASTAAGAITLISVAVTTAAYPRFSANFATNNLPQLRREFHQAINIISYFSFGFGFIIIFFSQNILMLWTGDIVLSNKTAVLLLFLAAGNIFYSIANGFYLLLIASSDIKVLLLCTLAIFSIFIPILMFTIPQYGIVAAAGCWFLENVISFFVYSVIANKRILKQDWSYFIKKDVYPYLTIAFLLMVAGKIISQMASAQLSQIIIISLLMFFYFTFLGFRIKRKILGI